VLGGSNAGGWLFDDKVDVLRGKALVMSTNGGGGVRVKNFSGRSDFFTFLRSERSKVFLLLAGNSLVVEFFYFINF